ncbi:MAG: protease SohB [Pseudomonadota bacterium]
MHFLADYGIFLLKTLTLVIAFIAVLMTITALSVKNKIKEKLVIKNLNKRLKKRVNSLKEQILSKTDYKKILKTEKKQAKAKQDKTKNRLFVLNFHGDIKASAVETLREEISAVLQVAKPKDEVVVLLESPGGMVHQYGLAASQLDRIRQAKIPLTVCVDKVAASGGYLMACVADKIVAAPFAIVGSIGVIAQLPNFHRLLKKNDIDFEQITAGEFKRTLTVFGENTDKAREKFKTDLEEIHQQFKDYITQHRPQVDIKAVATGEHWLGSKAKALNLLDELQTSDDYLIDKSKHMDVFLIKFVIKKPMSAKFSHFIQTAYETLFSRWH